MSPPTQSARAWHARLQLDMLTSAPPHPTCFCARTNELLLRASPRHTTALRTAPVQLRDMRRCDNFEEHCAARGCRRNITCGSNTPPKPTNRHNSATTQPHVTSIGAKCSPHPTCSEKHHARATQQPTVTGADPHQGARKSPHNPTATLRVFAKTESSARNAGHTKMFANTFHNTATHEREKFSINNQLPGAWGEQVQRINQKIDTASVCQDKILDTQRGAYQNVRKHLPQHRHPRTRKVLNKQPVARGVGRPGAHASIKKSTMAHAQYEKSRATHDVPRKRWGSGSLRTAKLVVIVAVKP